MQLPADTPAYTEDIHARLIFRSARPSGYNFTTVKAQASGSGSAFLTDLKKYRKYGVVIQAFNEKGPGPMSSEIVAQTLEDGTFFKKPLVFNPLNAELNPICYLLALLGAHHFLHVSRIMVKSLTLRLLMSYIYIYGAHILDVSRSHTTTQHSR